MRKPLYPRETELAASQITVTGAESYIGTAVIDRLLQAGHTVHATWRGTDAATIKHLSGLPNADSKLKLFVADLLVPGSFEKCLLGSRFLIHIASPCSLNPPKGQAEEKLIRPALEGIDNILTSALHVEGLEKVVVTSSVGAMAGDRAKVANYYTHNEADWNEVATDTYQPYSRSKTLAEQRAFEISERPECKWTLATVCPAIVQGPPLGRIKCSSTDFMVGVLGSFGHPLGTPVGMPFVDIDDVAAAHTLALATPDATGRFVICSSSMLLPEYLDLLRPEFAKVKQPFVLYVPHFVAWALLYFGIVAQGPDLDMLSVFYRRPPLFDNEKSRKVLGLEYIDIHDTAVDMARSVQALGYLST